MARGKKAVTAFYIITEAGNHFELDATTNIQINESNSLTSNPNQSGRSVTDHAIRNNSTITFTGKISSIKSVAFRSQQTFDTTEDYIRELRRLRDEASKVTVFATDEVDPYTNCVITNLSFSQSSGRGTFKVVNSSGETVIGGSSWDVSITFEQSTEASAAQEGVIAIPDQRREDQAGEGENFGDSPKRGPGRTIFESLRQTFGGDSPPTDEEITSIVGISPLGGTG